MALPEQRSCEDGISVTSRRSWLNRRVMEMINMIGAPQADLHRSWVKRLAVINGLAHAYVTVVLFRDR